MEKREGKERKGKERDKKKYPFIKEATPSLSTVNGAGIGVSKLPALLNFRE